MSVFGNAINKCINKETWFLSYNGVVPGPTIIIPTGHESIVRFNNKITRTYFKSEFDPCLPNNKRSDRPISVHLHGSASLPPYDGWTEDEICFGEAKDYVYPNFRSGTGWYHDHVLHITAQNAYKKMINNNVRWFKSNGFKINGSECNSGYKWLDGVRYCKTAFLPNDKFYN